MSSFENTSRPQRLPLLVVVMGVSGAGKTTLAKKLARQSGFTFLDADSLHSGEAIEQMSQGIPLTDMQREPWIQRIHSQLSEYQLQNKSCTLAYSGLKQQHRKVIFSAFSNTIGILLRADQGLIIERLAQRSGHFMSPQLLNSQIAEMQPFDDEIPLLTLDTADSVEQLISKSEAFIGLSKG